MQTVQFTEFEKFLKSDGWVKISDDDRRSKYNPRVVTYEKQLADRKLDVQLWGDGGHRACMMQNGVGQTVPTDFTTIEGMHEAIRIETERTDGYKGRDYSLPSST